MAVMRKEQVSNCRSLKMAAQARFSGSLRSRRHRAAPPFRFPGTSGPALEPRESRRQERRETRADGGRPLNDEQAARRGLFRR
jgi:hypothetical protein